MSPEEYGILNIVMSFNSVAMYLIILSLDSALMRYYNEYKDDVESIKRAYGTVLVIILATSTIFLTLCLVFRKVLLKTVFDGIDFVPYILLGLIILVLDSIYTIHRRMLETLQDGVKVTKVNILGIVISSIISLIFLSIFRLGVEGVLISSLIVSACTIIFMIYDIVVHHMIIFCFDKKYAKEMLKYSLPLVPHNMAGYLAALISRIFINISSGLSTVGLFGIATQFSAIIDTFQDSVFRAYRPWLFERLSKTTEQHEEEIASISRVLIALYSFVYVFIGLFAQDIIYIMTASSYHSAWKVVPILVAAYSIRSIYYFYIAQCFFYKKSSRRIFLASLIANLCNIIASYIFIPKIGVYGSALASFISIIINTGIIIMIDRENGDIGYDLKQFVTTILLSWVFIFVGLIPSYLFYQDNFSFANFLYKVVISVVYLLFIWIFYKRIIFKMSGCNTVSELFKKYAIRK